MKLLLSFKYAWNGIKHCSINELNFKIHLLGFVAVILTGYFFSISKTDWFFLIGCCLLVLVTEMVNTAIERLCDMVATEFHPAIKIIKDVAAGAVLVSVIGSVVIAGIIFFPKLFS